MAMWWRALHKRVISERHSRDIAFTAYCDTNSRKQVNWNELEIGWNRKQKEAKKLFRRISWGFFAISHTTPSLWFKSRIAFISTEIQWFIQKSETLELNSFCFAFALCRGELTKFIWSFIECDRVFLLRQWEGWEEVNFLLPIAIRT